jgi:hypothetical protein
LGEMQLEVVAFSKSLLDGAAKIGMAKVLWTGAAKDLFDSSVNTVEVDTDD